MKTTIRDLYRGPVNLWVEDGLTRAVLTELWQDAQINVLVADGSEGVRTMVQGARGHARYCDCVFGLVDRDFGAHDVAQLADPGARVFVLSMHEVENFLLDFEVLGALAEAAPGRVEQLAEELTHARRWWCVGKFLLRELRQDVLRGFPRDPPGALADRAALASWLAGQPFWATHRAEIDGWIERRLDVLTDDLLGALDSGWRAVFPGKEILQHLRGKLRRLDVKGSEEPELDLAKRIARRMRETARVPAELTALRTTLRRRVGLPPG